MLLALIRVCGERLAPVKWFKTRQRCLSESDGDGKPDPFEGQGASSVQAQAKKRVTRNDMNAIQPFYHEFAA
jgi:hypothetical protein